MLRSQFLCSLMMCLALAASAARAGDDNKAAWLEWRAETESHYAATRLAVLKAADARYLKAGETVYLAPKPDRSLHFTFEPSRADILQISFDGETAELNRDGFAFDLSALLAEGARYPVSERFDLGGGPSQLGKDTMGFRVILFDQSRAAAQTYEGGSWFDFNKDLVVKTKFIPAETMEARVIETERGLAKQYFLAGTVRIKSPDGAFDLPLYAATSDPSKIDNLFVSFTDKTTGAETYGVGRYLEFDGFGAFPPKTLAVDFNRAYNPYCARSPHYNCPKALVDLAVALRAGEKAPIEDH
jgi:hypothetical protein